MKKLLFFLTFVSALSSAQTTVTKAFNDPVAGETVNNFLVNGTVNNTPAGTNVTYNNASLTQGAAAVGNYSAPTVTETATYPGTTLRLISATTTAYYKQSASKLEITGLVTPDVTLNFITNNGTFISYPTAFGFSETDAAQGIFTNGVLSGTFTGTIANNADASGTLIIGNKTYSNILRVKSVQTFTLTSGFITGTLINTSYNYYAAAQKFPVLTSTSGTLVVPLLSINQNTTTATALADAFLSTQNAVFIQDKIQIYPNPVEDKLHLHGNLPAYKEAKIYSTDGKLVLNADLKNGFVDVAELPTGIYYIQISGNAVVTESLKFIKK